MATMKMTRTELNARALVRKVDERVRIYKTSTPGAYYTVSKSGKGQYGLYHNEDGSVTCECDGFFYRKSCKHASALAARLVREHEEPKSLLIDPAFPVAA